MRRPAEPGAEETPKGLPRHHTLTNLILEIKGKEASAKAYWMTASNARDGIPSIAGVGRYEDKLVKQDGKWYFKSREIINDFSRPRPAAAGSGSAAAPAQQPTAPARQ